MFIHNSGEDKKITNRFPQPSSVTCLVWLPNDVIVAGLADGQVCVLYVTHCFIYISTAQVRALMPKSNKTVNMYDTKQFTVSLAASGNTILSGHADGSIIRFFFDDDGNPTKGGGKMCVHSCPPYALAWGMDSFVAAGCDKRVTMYGADGRPHQQFDFNSDPTEHEFTAAASGPNGQTVVVGSFDRLRIFSWSHRKQAWEEGKAKEISNLYTISALSWRKDGSSILVGTLCGGVEDFDCSVKKAIYKNKFEITYVGASQVLVKSLKNDMKLDLRSQYGYEIGEVKILGNDAYVVAYTSDTLIVGYIAKNRMSEIAWRGGGQDKFCFDHDRACLISSGGELTVVEYGLNEALAAVRTEFAQPNLVSLRINERRQMSVGDNKKLAYLIDLKTAAVVDLVSGTPLGQIFHDTKIDWLDLNETGKKLLFRDKKFKLHLYDLEERNKSTLSAFCGFVQWVPGSDVIVAQSRDQLCVWYNADTPDRVSTQPIRGEACGVDFQDNKTVVLVNDGVSVNSVPLDSSMTEFGTALEDGDLGRAVLYLETLELTSETETMWKSLSRRALDTGQLNIAERCFAALGDISSARFLRETNRIAAELDVPDAQYHYKVQARLAILDGNFKLAESIYLDNNDLDEVFKMYQDVHKWEQAIAVAEARNHYDLDNMHKKYMQYLMSTHQEDKAGELRERQNDITGAIDLYLKANLPSRAASVVANDARLLSDTVLVDRIASALVRSEFYERAGDLYQRAAQDTKALENFKRGEAFAKAIDLARIAFPQEVVKLELMWADSLFRNKQVDAAINHYIEAGANVKAAEACIVVRQWSKAIEILKHSIRDSTVAAPFYRKIGEHHAQIGELEKAERLFIEAGAVKDAIEMYNKNGRWEDAHRLASKTMRPEEVSAMYLMQAKQFEAQGKFKDAEKLYCVVDEPDKAITMYKKQKMYMDTLRLVRQYHSDLEKETLKHIAKELEAENNLHAAEQMLIEAGEWKAALHMYRLKNQWEDAFRLARTHGGEKAAQQVVFLWAKALGGDAAIRLLQKHSMVDLGLEMALDTGAFEIGFLIANQVLPERLPEVHQKLAQVLEDEGKLKEAEEEFVKADKPREAVLMYVHARDWPSALRVAEQHDPESLTDILLAQAKLAFEEQDFAKGEAFLLRAQKPELIVKYYRDHGMWDDAMRVCKEYLPHKLELLQADYEKQSGGIAKKDIESLIGQAREFERNGDYQRAVECYRRVNPQMTSDQQLLQKSWIKAGELAIKFLDSHRAVAVVRDVGHKLMGMNLFNQAAELYLNMEMVKEAVDALIAGDDLNRARKIARQYEPALEAYIDEQHKRQVKGTGKAEQIAEVDVMTALDMYAERGQWDKCFDKARQLGGNVLHKYVAICATSLIKEGKTVKALELYTTNSAPAFPQNYNIYRRIALDIMSSRQYSGPDCYRIWADLRNMLFQLIENLEAAGSGRSDEYAVFESLLWIAHYYAVRSAAVSNQQLEAIAAKISIALLRYADVVDADKIFYEAGTASKKMNWDRMAFALTNCFLDIEEAIEEHDMSLVDSSMFEGTDIPSELALPEQPMMSEGERNDLKEWVLSMSLNRQIEQGLPKDERGVFESSLVAHGQRSPPCIITGYPVLNNRVEFKKAGKFANKDDWNKFLLTAKVAKTSELQDVIQFVTRWCGPAPNAF